MASKRWWRRPVVIVPTAIVAVTALTLALAAFQPWRLFIDVTVDEALPTVAVEETVEPSSDASAQEAAGDAGQDGSADSNAEEQSATDSTADSAADSSANASAEPSVEETPKRTVTAEGAFISHEHPTAGKARIITLEDGSRVLRLVGLDTDNGPDLKVWLAAAPVIEGRDGWFVFDDDEYLSLGALKGNKGNQNYSIPDDADISDLTSVTIWCERFSVSFGAAELIST
ncbi:MAG: DM13 domain-containing protein [Actinomycetales bacterium]|nr:DM13 domain-containing protein [Actinomycetales bacterium]MCP4893831.1 DM13 domain-containing protein [Actinomycetales bacterium]